MRTMNERRNLALRLGATEFELSDKENKLYYVVYNGRRIHFGSKTFDYNGLGYNGNGYTGWARRNMRHKNAGGAWLMNIDKTRPCYWVNYICWETRYAIDM